MGVIIKYSNSERYAMEFEKILTYPMERDDWVKTVLLGGVLILFGVLLVPLFLVYGYLVRTIRESLADSVGPPAFDDWGGLLVDGVQAWIISIVYLLVPLIVAGVTIGGTIAAIATGSEAGAAAGAGGLFVGFTLSAVLGLVFGYLAVVALVNFAEERRFAAAFDFGTIKTVASDREYAIAWLVSMIVLVVASFVGAIPLVGWLLAPFVTFYAAVIAANLWADGFTQAVSSTPGVSRPRDDESTV